MSSARHEPLLIHRLADVLLEIEVELRRLALWEAQSPPMERLASRQPFCCDTLAFTQWLQWIFIPRMKHVLAGHEPLPADSSIAAYAEECLPGMAGDTAALMRLLRRYDDLIRQQD